MKVISEQFFPITAKCVVRSQVHEHGVIAVGVMYDGAEWSDVGGEQNVAALAGLRDWLNAHLQQGKP